MRLLPPSAPERAGRDEADPLSTPLHQALAATVRLRRQGNIL